MSEFYYLSPILGAVAVAILGYAARYGVKYTGKWIANALVGTLSSRLDSLCQDVSAINGKINIIGNDVHYLRNNGQETRTKLNLLDRSNLGIEERIGELGQRVSRIEIRTRDEPDIG